MARKKTKRIPRKRRTVGPIYVSPDGGHTVYQQMANGTKKLISEDSYAEMMRTLHDDSDMFSSEAYKLRQKHPGLQKAYDQYKLLYKLIVDDVD